MTWKAKHPICLLFFLSILTINTHAAPPANPIFGDWYNDVGDLYQIRPLAAGEAKQPENPDEYIWVSHTGAGGKSFDPETGIMITSVDQGNGTALVTTTYSDGHQTVRTRPAAERTRIKKSLWQLQQKTAELTKLQTGRTYQWVNSLTKETILQKQYTVLAKPFEYKGEHYDSDDTAARVANITQEIATLNQTAALKPIDQNDPILYNATLAEPQAQPIIIHVEQKQPAHAYDIEQAQLFGNSIYARRTITDLRDISGLPPAVAAELVGSWSPPEWIKLSQSLDPVSKAPQLRGEVWRLHVTYAPSKNNAIESIHSAFSKPLVLFRNNPLAPPVPPAQTAPTGLQEAAPAKTAAAEVQRMQEKINTTIVDRIEVSADGHVQLRYKTQLQTPASEIELSIK